MTNTKRTQRVLIVDDRSTDLTGPYHLTRNLGFEAKLAFDGDQAFSEFERGHFDLIILDWNMPFLPGWAFLGRLETRKAGTGRVPRVIIHSGQEVSEELFSGATNYRVVDIWRKPLPPTEMLRRLKLLEEKGA